MKPLLLQRELQQCGEWSACLHCSYEAISILFYCHCSDFAVSSSCVTSSPKHILLKYLKGFESYNFKSASHYIAKTLTLDFYYTFHVNQFIAQWSRVLIHFFLSKHTSHKRHWNKWHMNFLLLTQTDFKNIRKYENGNEISWWALISDWKQLQIFLLK